MLCYHFAVFALTRARERLKKLKLQVGKTESENAAKDQELRKRATVIVTFEGFEF